MSGRRYKRPGVASRPLWFTPEEDKIVLDCQARGLTAVEVKKTYLKNRHVSGIRNRAVRLGKPFPKRGWTGTVAWTDREINIVKEQLATGEATLESLRRALPGRTTYAIRERAKRIRRKYGGYEISRKPSSFWEINGDRAFEIFDEGIRAGVTIERLVEKIATTLEMTKNSVRGFLWRSGGAPIEAEDIDQAPPSDACAYPEGDWPNLSYCRGGRHPQKPYCLEHCRVAYIDFDRKNPDARKAHLQAMQAEAAAVLSKAEKREGLEP